MINARQFLTRVALVTVGGLAVIAASAVLALALSSGIRAVFEDPVFDKRGESSMLDTLVDWAYRNRRQHIVSNGEDVATRMNNEAIDAWIERCTRKLLSDQKGSTPVKANADGLSSRYRDEVIDESIQNALLPAASDLRLLAMSISRGRWESSTNATKAYTVLQVSTWLAILIGLATTVLVSFGSTEFGKGDTKTARTIRILAIIFPALGTAAAAITAFYAPREDLARSSQALASLRQVHEQIAAELGSVKCPTRSEVEDGKGEITLKLVSWKKSLKDSRTITEAASLAAIDPSRSQGQPTGKTDNTVGAPVGGAPKRD